MGSAAARGARASDALERNVERGFCRTAPGGGRWIHVLTVVDQNTGECFALHADTALSSEKAAAALDRIVASCGTPKSVTVDNGTELASKAMDHWAYSNGVHLDFIRPGRPVENSYIESFNGNRARQTGTNRTTQPEISSLFGQLSRAGS